MRDKMMTALVKLTLCPGRCNGADVCKVCDHRTKILCEEHLREECTALLMEVIQPGTPEAQVIENLVGEIKKPQRDVECIVTDMIREIGMPAHLKGYKYMREAIILCVDNPSLIDAITKELYPKIARKFDTTASRVERALRHSIEIAWDRGDLDVLQKYFGYTVSLTKGKPTNSEFIAMVSDHISMKLKEVS